MSDTTISTSYAGPAYYGLLGELVADSEVSKQQVDLLSEQAGTGLISTTFSGLGTSSKLALDLSSEIGHDAVWNNNISTADTQISLTQTSMNQIGSIASSFYALTDRLTGADPSAIDDVAGEARTALQEVAGLLDTTDAGNYVFAGQDSANPPVPDPDHILTSGFYTQINTAVAALSANGATATAASTLAIASSNASGTSPFSAGLSQPAASLQATRTTVTFTNNQTVQIGLLASANASVTSTGTSTTGSYIRDLMRSLATIGSLNSSQVSDTGFEGLVADTRSSLGGAVTAISGEEGILGDTQAQIDATGTILTQTKLSLTTQLSNIEDADMAEVATKLTAAQTQLTASYKLISSAGTLSLVNFI